MALTTDAEVAEWHIRIWYVLFLKRRADAGGLANWLNVWANEGQLVCLAKFLDTGVAEGKYA